MVIDPRLVHKLHQDFYLKASLEAVGTMPLTSLCQSDTQVLLSAFQRKLKKNTTYIPEGPTCTKFALITPGSILDCSRQINWDSISVWSAPWSHIFATLLQSVCYSRKQNFVFWWGYVLNHKAIAISFFLLYCTRYLCNPCTVLKDPHFPKQRLLQHTSQALWITSAFLKS